MESQSVPKTCTKCWFFMVMNSSIPWESVKSLKNAAKTKQTSQRITKVKLQGLPDIHGTYHKKKPLKPIGSPWDIRTIVPWRSVMGIKHRWPFVILHASYIIAGFFSVWKNPGWWPADPWAPPAFALAHASGASGEGRGRGRPGESFPILPGSQGDGDTLGSGNCQPLRSIFHGILSNTSCFKVPGSLFS